MKSQTITVQEASSQTIGQVIRAKILNSFHKSNGKKIVSILGRGVLTIGITLLLVSPTLAKDLGLWVLSTQNHLIPKLIFALCCVFGLQKVSVILGWAKKRIHPNHATIEGVPVSDLLHHLFTTGHFKRDVVEKKFGMPRNRYDCLSKQLRKLEVLVRGPNNSNVLTDQMTRAEVAGILAGKTRARDINVPIKIYSNGRSDIPSKEEVEVEINQNLHSPANYFTIRPIA